MPGGMGGGGELGCLSSICSRISGVTRASPLDERAWIAFLLRTPNGDFYFARRARKLRYYGDVIHSFDWKSAVEHDGGV